MEKIIIFFVILFSGRHLQNATDFGLKVKSGTTRVYISTKKSKPGCFKERPDSIIVYKSFYCWKKSQSKNYPITSQIFSHSKKRKPPSTKRGLELYIPAKAWSVIHFLD